MESTIDNNRKYPIGPFERKEEYSAKEISDMILSIEIAPSLYQEVFKDFDQDDLAKTYRPGSWTVQQLVHHVADIQLLHFFRMKKALTERDYSNVTLIDMDTWATTPDATEELVQDSLLMLDGITKRYVYLMRSLKAEQLKIEYYHPVRKYSINQAQAIGMSAWHLQHHLAHIKLAIE